MSSRPYKVSTSQFELLRKKRFFPFFLTQFFGAFNDNVFKNALFILIAFQSIYSGSSNSNTIINIAAILFIFPFFIFSAIAGQIADRYEKSKLIRIIKLTEIAIMLLASIGFYLNNIPLLLFALFLMGFQSSLFGPIKYSIIPQHLSKKELIGGNALVESGTFIAILLGTMLGGILISISSHSELIVPSVIVALAIIGFVSSLSIPTAPPVAPNLIIKWNPLIETFKNLKYLKENNTVFYPVLGISWFWFLGATYITQLPNFTHLSLGANEQVVIFFLALFCVGIGFGSLLCERLSNRIIELGLAPIGSIGLTLFGADIFFAYSSSNGIDLIGFNNFISDLNNWRLIVDIFLIGTFGGIYIVPLYTHIQTRTEPSHRSRVIAGNNILNAIFIVIAGIFAIFILNAGFTIPQLFLLLSILNIIVALSIYTLVPEFIMRFIIWVLVHLVYRVKKINLEYIPENGPVLIVSNHVSLVDALIIAGCVPRPIHFVTHHKTYSLPLLRFIFRTPNTIPIASKNDNFSLLNNKAYKKIAAVLKQGNVVGVFPEGNLTSDGNLGVFDPILDRIIKDSPMLVIPLAINGLWGSYFSNYAGRPMQGFPHKLPSKVTLIAGSPINAKDASSARLKVEIKKLISDEH